MATPRSPNYPQIPLGDAIQFATKIWSSVQSTKVSQEELVSCWGYSGLSGPAKSKISALRKYGLLTKEEGGLRLSDQAVQLMVHPEDSEEYREAIQAAALSPEVFRDIWQTRRGVSDQTLRAYLIAKQGYSVKGADQFISAYRQTVELAQLDRQEYDGGRKDLGEESGTQLMPQFPLKERQDQKSGMKQDTFTLEEGQVILQWPERFSPDSYEDFKHWIELVLKKAKRSITKDDSESES